MAVDMFIIMIDTSVHTLTVSLELDIQLINRWDESVDPVPVGWNLEAVLFEPGEVVAVVEQVLQSPILWDDPDHVRLQHL